MKAVLLALTLLCTPAFVDAAVPAAASKAYGQRLVAELDLDAAQLAKFRQHVASTRDTRDSPLEAMLAADTEGWRGDSLVGEAGRNPYTIVVTMSGTVDADGEAMGSWMAGWQNEEGMSHMFPLPGLGKLRADANERFVTTVASAPVRLTEGKAYRPELELRDLGGVALESMHVQIWSGVPDASPLEEAFAYRYAWIAVLAVGIWWLFYGRR